MGRKRIALPQPVVYDRLKNVMWRRFIRILAFVVLYAAMVVALILLLLGTSSPVWEWSIWGIGNAIAE
jgi:integral membrane sensor domain MASE1